jgi:hypothetical protein
MMQYHFIWDTDQIYLPVGPQRNSAIFRNWQCSGAAQKSDSYFEMY